MYSGKSITNLILNYCKKHSIKISCVYLQALLYLIQEYFCCFDEMCLIEEKFRAYSFGPAIKEILDDFDDITAPIDYGKYKAEGRLPQKVKVAVVKYLDVHFSNQGDGNIFFITNRVRSHKPYYEAYENDKSKTGEAPIIPQEEIVNYCKELISAIKAQKDG